MREVSTTEMERALLSPMWTRIAKGEVDLAAFTDEEILTGDLLMADGRTVPRPKVFPETFIREQIKRQLATAERKIRAGAMVAIDVYAEIMANDSLEPRDRMQASEFFTSRFLGKESSRMHVVIDDQGDPRTRLLERLLAARSKLPPDQVISLANNETVEDVVDAEVIEDATLTIEDLI